MEVWKDVPGYEGYYRCSNLGNVKSIDRFIEKSGNLIFRKGVLLKPGVRKKYKYIVLSKKSKTKAFLLHQVVAITFMNHIPNGHKIVIDHINNDSLDNRLENLQLITHKENINKDIKRKYSKYPGVSYDKSRNKWISFVRVKGKHKSLGRFKTESEAKEKLDDFKLKNNIK